MSVGGTQHLSSFSCQQQWLDARRTWLARVCVWDGVMGRLDRTLSVNKQRESISPHHSHYQHSRASAAQNFKTSPSEHPFKVPREGVTICRVHVTTTSVPAAGGIDHNGGGRSGYQAGWGTVHILGFIKLTHQPSWPGEMMG